MSSLIKIRPFSRSEKSLICLADHAPLAWLVQFRAPVRWPSAALCSLSDYWEAERLVSATRHASKPAKPSQPARQTTKQPHSTFSSLRSFRRLHSTWCLICVFENLFVLLFSTQICFLLPSLNKSSVEHVATSD